MNIVEIIAEVTKYFAPEYPRQKMRFKVSTFAVLKVSSDNIMNPLKKFLKLSEADVQVGYIIIDGLYSYYIDKYRGGKGGY
jgi:hypothetical protein